MAYNILEITYIHRGEKGLCFIDLSKDNIVEDFQWFANGCSDYPHRSILSIRYVDKKLTNW